MHNGIMEGDSTTTIMDTTDVTTIATTTTATTISPTNTTGVQPATFNPNGPPPVYNNTTWNSANLCTNGQNTGYQYYVPPHARAAQATTGVGVVVRKATPNTGNRQKSKQIKASTKGSHPYMGTPKQVYNQSYGEEASNTPLSAIAPTFTPGQSNSQASHMYSAMPEQPSSTYQATQHASNIGYAAGSLCALPSALPPGGNEHQLNKESIQNNPYSSQEAQLPTQYNLGTGSQRMFRIMIQIAEYGQQDDINVVITSPMLHYTRLIITTPSPTYYNEADFYVQMMHKSIDRAKLLHTHQHLLLYGVQSRFVATHFSYHSNGQMVTYPFLGTKYNLLAPPAGIVITSNNHNAAYDAIYTIYLRCQFPEVEPIFATNEARVSMKTLIRIAKSKLSAVAVICKVLEVYYRLRGALIVPDFGLSEEDRELQDNVITFGSKLGDSV
jgi:hypothetical protein